jgi:hypothetical protein
MKLSDIDVVTILHSHGPEFQIARRGDNWFIRSNDEDLLGPFPSMINAHVRCFQAFGVFPKLPG